MATDTPISDTDMPKLLTAPQLARYLDVPVSTLYFWRSCARGPRATKIGKELRYRASDVAAWLEERNTVSGDSPTSARKEVDEKERA